MKSETCKDPLQKNDNLRIWYSCWALLVLTTFSECFFATGYWQFNFQVFSWNSELMLYWRPSQKELVHKANTRKPKNKNHCVHFILQNHGTFAITQERTCVNKHMCVLPQQPVHHLPKFLKAQKSMRVAFTLCIGSAPKLPRKAVTKGEAMTFCKARVQLFYFISNPPVYSPQPWLTTY